MAFKGIFFIVEYCCKKKNPSPDHYRSLQYLAIAVTEHYYLQSWQKYFPKNKNQLEYLLYLFYNG